MKLTFKYCLGKTTDEALFKKKKERKMKKSLLIFLFKMKWEVDVLGSRAAITKYHGLDCL